ncbi:hypothetical protein [Streptomyces lushanensis]|uniref:hypothetical protein n=1 Tax=Streptomyces lushanensis TaxID=1434255 RepID=UPI00082976F6|nr:hypothetical protein [Streptomyces lushanensis]
MEPGQDSARGLVRLEGHLLWNAEVADARARASRFSERLPWLTTPQREEVERAYVADRLALSRATLVHVSERAAELREEYAGCYERLRTRCVAAAVVAVGAASGACAAVTLLAR